MWRLTFDIKVKETSLPDIRLENNDFWKIRVDPYAMNENWFLRERLLQTQVPPVEVRQTGWRGPGPRTRVSLQQNDNAI
jgi:hypothetical protein